MAGNPVRKEKQDNPPSPENGMIFLPLKRQKPHLPLLLEKENYCCSIATD